MKYGAMPPPGFEWQIGKTAASIEFVVHSERFIKNCPYVSDIDKLRDAIDRVKNGKLVFNIPITPEIYLEQN